MGHLKQKKGQGLLETAITIVLMVLLLGGIINIWLWATKQVVLRQRRYNATRVIAGTAADNYVLRYPVYAPPALREDKVLLDAPLLPYETEDDNIEPSGPGSGGDIPAATGPGTRGTPFADPLATDNLPEEYGQYEQ